MVESLQGQLGKVAEHLFVTIKSYGPCGSVVRWNVESGLMVSGQGTATQTEAETLVSAAHFMNPPQRRHTQPRRMCF